MRTVVTNEKLKAKVAVLKRGTTEFVKVPIDSGIALNGYIMKPADFDPSKKYPILFQVYGGPRLADSGRFLGREPSTSGITMLTQQGYLVASVDNRGTRRARPGVAEDASTASSAWSRPKDQAAAAKAMGRWTYVDSTAHRHLGLELRRVHEPQRRSSGTQRCTARRWRWRR